MRLPTFGRVPAFSRVTPAIRRNSLFLMDMQSRVRERMRSWVTSKTSLLVAVSGGPDSVALAHCLRSLPHRLVIAHVDHGLRKSAAPDAEFVRRLAQRWNLRFELAHVNVSVRQRE